MTEEIMDWDGYWKKVSEQCAWCDKKGIIKCPDCGWEACEDHSREDKKCFYCTIHKEPYDPAKVEKMVEFIEKCVMIVDENGNVLAKNLKKSKDDDIVGFRLTLLDNKAKKVKIDLKRSNSWDTIFLMRKLSVISKWSLDCNNLFEKLDCNNEDIDKDEIIDEIKNLIDNINIQTNKMNIWFGFKDINSLYFKVLEKLYNTYGMRDREIHQHLSDDMDLMDKYKELLHET